MSFTFRSLDPTSDAPLLHSWVTQPYAAFWDMLGCTVADVAAEYSAIQSSGHHHAMLGLDDGKPTFLIEAYRPESSPLANVYAVRAGDLGMHLLVARPAGPSRPGYTTRVMDAVLERLFADPGVERIVVEPDARNTKIHFLNARLGFLPAGELALPGKRALLSFCTRTAFRAARADLHSSPTRQGATL